MHLNYPWSFTRAIFGVFLSLCLLFALTGCSSMRRGGAGENGRELSEADLNAQREARFAGGSIPTPESDGPFRNIHFDFDSSAISDVARQDIDYNVEMLKQNPSLRVQLEGHCDERGTAEYNMVLGQSRAQAVQKLLVSYGISSSRLSTISYGEEVALDPGHDESAWAKNRRVHFSAFSENK